jgi:hypothetical protein
VVTDRMRGRIKAQNPDHVCRGNIPQSTDF